MKKIFNWKDVELLEELREVEDFTTINSSDEIHDVIVKNMEKLENDFHRYEFYKVHFINCKFDKVSFARCYFEEVIFENCVFDQCNFANSTFHIIKQINTSHRNTDFSESSFYCAKYYKCSMKYSNFNGCKIVGFRDGESDFNSAFFSNCMINHAFFEKTSFCSADFFRTPLKGIDFSDCDIEGIIVSDNKMELNGIIVNTFQAAGLARLFGIVVK